MYISTCEAANKHCATTYTCSALHSHNIIHRPHIHTTVLSPGHNATTLTARSSLSYVEGRPFTLILPTFFTRYFRDHRGRVWDQTIPVDYKTTSRIRDWKRINFARQSPEYLLTIRLYGNGSEGAKMPQKSPQIANTSSTCKTKSLVLTICVNDRVGRRGKFRRFDKVSEASQCLALQRSKRHSKSSKGTHSVRRTEGRQL